MRAKKIVLIYFKTVKAKKSTQGKKKIYIYHKVSKVNSRLNKMNSRPNKENHSGKTNSANSLGAGLSHFYSSFLV